MRVVLLGYGKMGRLIEALSPDANIEIVALVDNPVDSLPPEFDVAIDFTEPSAVVGNVRRIAEAGKSLVVGTTGWNDHLEEVNALVERHQIGLVYSSNFSVGVNVFFKLAARAAELLRDLPEYEAWAYEVHHSAKKDAPSGTLLQTVGMMRDSGYDRPIDVASNRVGKVPGTHEIGFDSSADTIQLIHTARNREGFARGALLAARLIHGKVGLYRFGDLL